MKLKAFHNFSLPWQSSSSIPLTVRQRALAQGSPCNDASSQLACKASNLNSRNRGIPGQGKEQNLQASLPLPLLPDLRVSYSGYNSNSRIRAMADAQKFEAVEDAVEGEAAFNLVEGKLLRDFCTWGIGGPAKYFAEVRAVAELAAIVQHCRSHGIRFFILGKGSNCLFDDRGFNGCVILNRIEFVERLGQQGVYRAGAGFGFNHLGIIVTKDGFSGLEFASGIPGTVGGAVYMNAGADGQETADCLVEVEVLLQDGRIVSMRKEDGELEYSYRTSPFQNMQELAAIVSATFKLQPSSNACARQKECMDKRRHTQPITERTAGCVFRNPGKGGSSAGALIDRLGLKGHAVGGCQVSDVHANFLLNASGSSTCTDMLSLISDIKQRVRTEAGIQLVEEIQYVPFQDASDGNEGQDMES